MEKIDGKTYKDDTIKLDGQHFENCKFIQCLIVYHGTDVVELHGCSFDTCTWHFNGPAARTINFMRALYQAGSKELVEQTFESIRATKP